MSGNPREEMIALGSEPVTRERLTAYIEALGRGAIFLSCDSRITAGDECGTVLRMTRRDLQTLKAVLSRARDAFDAAMEALVR